jgi:hypothetical protein
MTTPMTSASLLAATRDARKAALAADRAGDTARAATIRARATDLAALLTEVTAAEAAPRLAAEAARHAVLAAAWNRAMNNLVTALSGGSIDWSAPLV